MNDDELLANIAWHALTGPQAGFAEGAGSARRYAHGFSPIIAFADPERPDFDALAPFCEAGEHFYCVGWSGPCPAGWRIDAEGALCRMVWAGALPDTGEPPPGTRALGPQDAPAALALTELTKPGPFGPRTLELGEYLGCFDAGPGLVAMAGERMQAGTLREISGVCTHPQFQGAGLARRLMQLLIRRQVLRGETPFLHVMYDNTGARGLYERMGFVEHQRAAVRVVSLA